MPLVYKLETAASGCTISSSTFKKIEILKKKNNTLSDFYSFLYTVRPYWSDQDTGTDPAACLGRGIKVCRIWAVDFKVFQPKDISFPSLQMFLMLYKYCL